MKTANFFSNVPLSLREKSAQIGSNPHLIQGAGGNVSFKNEAALYVKASGTCLSAAMAQHIFVEVSRADVLAKLATGDEEFASLVKNSLLRPSIETPLHALMTQEVVVHAHCVNTIARSAMGQQLADFQALLPEMRCGIVPYKRPGLPLAYAVQEVLHDQPMDVLILKNHGLVVGGESVEHAFELLDYVQRQLALAPRKGKSANKAFLEERLESGWIIPDNTLWHSLATDETAFACASKGSLYPDHVVFLGDVFPVAEEHEKPSEALLRIQATTGSVPRYLVYKNKGVLVSEDIIEAETAMLSALALVCARLSPAAALHTLSPQDVFDLTHWDAEQFRKSLAQ